MKTNQIIGTGEEWLAARLKLLKEEKVSLTDLFKGRSQLLVYHFMFRPDWTAGCPCCSSIADGFNGSVVHLANHDEYKG